MALFRCSGLLNYITKIEISMTLKVKVTTINGNTGTEVSGSANTKTFSNNNITINLDHTTPTVTYTFSKASGISDYFLSKAGYSPGKGKAQITSWTISSVTITMKNGSTITL